MALAAGALIATIAATSALASETNRYAAWEDQNNELVVALKAQGASHVYGGYWTCDRLIFASREQILCGVIADDLTRGLNRYPSYWDAVHEQQEPVPILVRNSTSLIGSESELDSAIHRALTGAAVPYETIQIGPYTLYKPRQPVPLPDPSISWGHDDSAYG